MGKTFPIQPPPMAAAIEARISTNLDVLGHAGEVSEGEWRYILGILRGAVDSEKLPGGLHFHASPANDALWNWRP